MTLRSIISSRNLLTDLQRNKVLRKLLKKSLYSHFCAGENRNEVRETLDALKKLRYDGVILEYALEAIDTEVDAAAGTALSARDDKNEKAILAWRNGLQETLQMLQNDDFVGLKYAFFVYSLRNL